MKQNFEKILDNLLPDHETMSPLLVGLTGLAAGIMLAFRLLL